MYNDFNNTEIFYKYVHIFVANLLPKKLSSIAHFETNLIRIFKFLWKQFQIPHY